MAKKKTGKARKKLPKRGSRTSLYDVKLCLDYKGKRYELMIGNPWGHKYREIFSSDDYDYVEDKKLIKALDKAFSKGCTR